jgi:hypothetical protein
VEEKGLPRAQKRLRRGVFKLEFKRGEEPFPQEVRGPIVGIFPLTRHSYEIIWIEEDLEES